MNQIRILHTSVLSICALAMVPATAIAEWQIDGSVDIPIEGVPYNDVI